MADSSPNPELLRSLGRLLRGLSALFWGLPIALIVCVQAAKADWLGAIGLVLPLLVTGWLIYGLWQLQHFQKQERIWRNALDRAQLFAWVNLGLSPFLYWGNKMPAHAFFGPMVTLFAVSSLIFLSCINLVLQRLSAMLPDETLRSETKYFTTVNRGLLLAAAALTIIYQAAVQFQWMSLEATQVLEQLEGQGRWLIILKFLPLAIFVLLPLAMTMALLWKIKETILDSVFDSEHRPS